MEDFDEEAEAAALAAEGSAVEVKTIEIPASPAAVQEEAPAASAPQENKRAKYGKAR